MSRKAKRIAKAKNFLAKVKASASKLWRKIKKLFSR